MMPTDTDTAVAGGWLVVALIAADAGPVHVPTSDKLGGPPAGARLAPLAQARGSPVESS